MVLQGRIENGAIVIPSGLTLPNGTEVTVIVERSAERSAATPPAKGERVKLPLVPSKLPASRALTAERIAELLDADELSP